MSLEYLTNCKSLIFLQDSVQLSQGQRFHSLHLETNHIMYLRTAGFQSRGGSNDCIPTEGRFGLRAKTTRRDWQTSATATGKCQSTSADTDMLGQ